MRIVVTGSTGLVGSPLVRQLQSDGHSVVRLTRVLNRPDETIILWNPKAEEILNHGRMEGMDAVFHLAGENIAGGRWTAQKKSDIRNSRVQGTGLLCKTLATLNHKPKVLVTASAIGYYGDRGDETLTEDSARGEGFLAGVCRDWEEATDIAESAGIRCVNARIGIVLSKNGGALEQMLKIFRTGMGGQIGNGRQWMSWTSREDVVAGMIHCMRDESLRGPVNLVSPNPVTNKEFTKTLGRVLSRPTIARVPTLVARMMGGEMADELLLSSTRVEPRKLIESGFAFQHPDLEGALQNALEIRPESALAT